MSLNYAWSLPRCPGYCFIYYSFWFHLIDSYSFITYIASSINWIEVVEINAKILFVGTETFFLYFWLLCKVLGTPWTPSVHHLLSFTLDDDTNCGYSKQEANYRKEIPLDFTFVMEDTSLWRIMQWMVEYHYVLSLFLLFLHFD